MILSIIAIILWVTLITIPDIAEAARRKGYCAPQIERVRVRVKVGRKWTYQYRYRYRYYYIEGRGVGTGMRRGPHLSLAACERANGLVTPGY